MTKPAATWNARQVKMFAKLIAESDEGRAWWSFHPKLRDAIISHRVLMIVFSLYGTNAINVGDVRALRNLIEERLANHYNLKVTP